jgi:hypothetical protein
MVTYQCPLHGSIDASEALFQPALEPGEGVQDAGTKSIAVCPYKHPNGDNWLCVVWNGTLQPVRVDEPSDTHLAL